MTRKYTSIIPYTESWVAAGGAGSGAAPGGAGGNGRIAIRYKTSYTGTSTPTLNATQDATLPDVGGGSGNFFNFLY